MQINYICNDFIRVWHIYYDSKGWIHKYKKKVARKHWDRNLLHLQHHPRSHDLEYLFCWLWGGHVFPDSLSGLVTNGCFPFTDLIAPLNRFWADPTLMGCQGKQEENISKKRLLTWHHYFCYQRSHFQPRLYIDPQNGVNCSSYAIHGQRATPAKICKIQFQFSIKYLVFVRRPAIQWQH